MHTGSIIIASSHNMFKTYVDDVSNVAAGAGPDVQDAVVRCAFSFSSLIVVKRKFRLSKKSATVASDKKLGAIIAAELAEHGLVVQNVSSTRDVGIMFAAGVHRDISLSTSRRDKATKRTARIARVAKACRAARKLFTSGAYPQATWGHQCVGCSPVQIRSLRRLAASTTGVSTKSQRCLTSCIGVCFGFRADP